MTYQELLQQIKGIKKVLGLNHKQYAPLSVIVPSNKWDMLKNSDKVNQKVLKAFYQATEELYTFNTVTIARHIYKQMQPMKKGIFKYILHIPTEIMLDTDELPYDNISSFNQVFGSVDGVDLSRSLVNTKMNALTQNIMHYTTVGHNVNYPDLLAAYIDDEELKKAVKSITYNKAVINMDDNYNLVFNITAVLELNNSLKHKLIDYMAGQMSDGLLENGLTLAQHVENPDYDEEDEYASDDEYCDVILWPKWTNTNVYQLYKKKN